jgi:hypothetical protein
VDLAKADAERARLLDDLLDVFADPAIPDDQAGRITYTCMSFGSAARKRPELLNRYRCGPRHNDSTPPPCSVGFVSTRSPACKPAIRFASFSGEADNGCWWIGRFVGRERRIHISSCGEVLAQGAAGALLVAVDLAFGVAGSTSVLRRSITPRRPMSSRYGRPYTVGLPQSPQT